MRSTSYSKSFVVLTSNGELQTLSTFSDENTANCAILNALDSGFYAEKYELSRVLDCVDALAGIANPAEFVKAAFALVAEIQDDNRRDSLDSCSKSALAKLAAFFPSLAPKGA